MTSGHRFVRIKDLARDLPETAKYSFFEVSEAGAITGLGAYGGVVAFGLADIVGNDRRVTWIFNIL